MVRLPGSCCAGVRVPCPGPPTTSRGAEKDYKLPTLTIKA